MEWPGLVTAAGTKGADGDNAEVELSRGEVWRGSGSGRGLLLRST
jgi:hypothetical protein